VERGFGHVSAARKRGYRLLCTGTQIMANLTIGEWVSKTNRNLDQTMRGIKLSLFKGVIMDTRVDTGRMRGNWQTSTGAPTFTQTTRLDQSGNQAIAEAEYAIKPVAVDYLSNNVPYVGVYEELDGMVKKNMARLVTNIRNEVAKAR
jgi:hypothetical protein